MNTYTGQTITFPPYTGVRCLMMPYIQGDPDSVPAEYRNGYGDIIANTFIEAGDIGFLTIDESPAKRGTPHRGDRAKHGRALHTEAGIRTHNKLGWGPRWGESDNVTLERDVQVLLANNIDGSCALWDAEHPDTTDDGDIGHLADQYPYGDAIFMRAGEVHQIGILTPHESMPVAADCDRQFLRIVSSGVHGREPYFTENPLVRLH